MYTASSMSKPKICPLLAITPTTRKRSCPMCRCCPKGFWLGNNSLRIFAPITTRLRACWVDSAGRKLPLAMCNCHVCGASWFKPSTVVQRVRLSASTGELPCTTGTAVCTPVMRRKLSASSSDKGRTLLIIAPDTPNVLLLPGLIAIMFAPNWVNCLRMYCCAPLPNAVSNTTAAIPTAIPSAVSTLRIRLKRILVLARCR